MKTAEQSIQDLTKQVYLNRAQRRKKAERLFNNRKSTPIVLFGRYTFIKKIQCIELENGSWKKIVHYVPKI